MEQKQYKLNSFQINSSKPFLKWAGGKTQLLKQFVNHYPIELNNGKINKYFEPFLGGGSVFIYIAKNYNIKEAYLTDINPELVMSFNVIKKNPLLLIKALEEYSGKYYELSFEHQKDYFYEVRDEFNCSRMKINFSLYSDNWINRTAQLIFLNKTCFNGLFRVNKSGGFNVPFGKYKSPKILDKENLMSLSELLQIAKINCGEYFSTENYIDDKSFVYFDPPYRPISDTASFTSYSKNGFNDNHQIQLGNYFAKLHNEKNAKLMLSNSDPTIINPKDHFFKNLYARFKLNKVIANRMINCDGKGRGQISEILITNY